MQYMKYKYYLTTNTHMSEVEVYSVNKLTFWAMDKNVVGKKPGGTRLLKWIGGAAGGPEPDPVILRSAHKKSTLSYCTLLKTFKCIPCCNIAHLEYTLSVSVWLGALSWQAKKKVLTSAWIADQSYYTMGMWPCEPRWSILISCANGDDHIRPIWYPVPVVMTTLGRYLIPCADIDDRQNHILPSGTSLSPSITEVPPSRVGTHIIYQLLSIL